MQGLNYLTFLVSTLEQLSTHPPSTGLSNSSSFDYWDPTPGQVRSSSPPDYSLHTWKCQYFCALSMRYQDTERLHNLPKGILNGQVLNLNRG